MASTRVVSACGSRARDGADVDARDDDDDDDDGARRRATTTRANDAKKRDARVFRAEGRRRGDDDGDDGADAESRAGAGERGRRAARLVERDQV